MVEHPTVVVARHWRAGNELAFVARSIAGAASRAGTVAVLVPGPVGAREADGAFDLQGIGEDGSLAWPLDLPGDEVVIVDELTPDVHALRRGGLFLSGPTGADGGGAWQRIRFVEGDGERPVGLFVPVNPQATQHRHHGFGFTGYVLVLTDRTQRREEPPPAVAWLTSAFHNLEVVVVEDAMASAWKGRALRGTTTVDTRMDLWRLMAHAATCIDLAPGSLVARECVEALRLGTPIIVPEDAAAAALHAQAGGGSTFADAAGLLEATDKFVNEANRAPAVVRGRGYADAWFGEPAAFVDRLTRRLRQPLG